MVLVINCGDHYVTEHYGQEGLAVLVSVGERLAIRCQRHGDQPLARRERLRIETEYKVSPLKSHDKPD